MKASSHNINNRSKTHKTENNQNLSSKFPFQQKFSTVKSVCYKPAPKIQYYISKLARTQYSNMMRRSNYALGDKENIQVRNQKKCNSNSTIDSGEGSAQSKHNKEKSQLCKKYIDGYCPYGQKCKFAHGLQELRKNNECNLKYKTKECGSFKNNQYCVYGDRCNFIHATVLSEKIVGSSIFSGKCCDVEMDLIRKIAQKESKLLKLLF